MTSKDLKDLHRDAIETLQVDVDKSFLLVFVGALAADGSALLRTLLVETDQVNHGNVLQRTHGDDVENAAGAALVEAAF